MNRVEVKVEKIRSYQTLTYKNGKNSFRKAEYKAYIQEISYQLTNLKPCERSAILSVKLHFKHKNKAAPDIDNATKPILDILQLSGKIHNDRNICELHAIKSFGHEENSIEIELKELIE